MTKLRIAHGLAAAFLLSTMAGCIAEGPEVDEEVVAESTAAVCADVDDSDLDYTVRMLGQDGLACSNKTATCLTFGSTKLGASKFANKPQPIEVGMSYPKFGTPLHECTAGKVGLTNCQPPPQAYHCEFGGDCNCTGLIDCLDLVWGANCEPGSLRCDDYGCTCENTDGC